MPTITLSQKARQLEARRRELGITPDRIEVARNKGTSRTPEKRALLRELEDRARRQRRKPDFAADV